MITHPPPLPDRPGIHPRFHRVVRSPAAARRRLGRAAARWLAAGSHAPAAGLLRLRVPLGAEVPALAADRAFRRRPFPPAPWPAANRRAEPGHPSAPRLARSSGVAAAYHQRKPLSTL